MGKSHYDAIVVGGGMGGLNLAALLASDGHRVLVLERADRSGLGGRAASGHEAGSPIDNGIKGLILAGTQDEIFERIGKQMPANVCTWTNSGKLLLSDGQWHPLDQMVLGTFEEFTRAYLDPVKNMSYAEIESLNDVSTEAYAQMVSSDPAVIDFFRYIGWLFGGTMPVPYDYSAGSMFYSVRRQLDAIGHFPSQSYWVEGGSGAIAGPLVESIEENGGEIRTGSPVSRVIIENRRATGVEVCVGSRRTPMEWPSLERIGADVVVSAVPIWDIFSIVDETDLDPWYAASLQHIHRKTLNLVTLTYGFEDPELWDHTGPRWVQKGPVSGRPWCASSMEFPGERNRYQVTFWMQLGWWEEPDVFAMREARHKASLTKLVDAFEADIDELFDGLTTKAAWSYHSFGPATIMETPGYVGESLPDIAVNGVERLFMIGERTREAKVMGVYGSAQVALAAHAEISRLLGSPVAAGAL